MVKKDIVIAILATFCLTSALFMIIPSKSSPSVGEYDPWIDINGDGIIDGGDLGILGGSWYTSGDPTKNVNVTNWPTTTNVNVTNWPENRPAIVRKGIQRIQIMESMADGVHIGAGFFYLSAFFLFDFEPLGQLINITKFYLAAVWKTPDNSLYILRYTINFYHDFDDAIDHTMNPRAWWNSFEPVTGITQGMNELAIWRPNTSPSGDIILYRLELFIEYNYLG
jgi:hypothetical protein